MFISTPYDRKSLLSAAYRVGLVRLSVCLVLKNNISQMRIHLTRNLARGLSRQVILPNFDKERLKKIF